MFPHIKKLIPYFSVLIIGMGVLRYLIFFNYFNISIKSFITTGELLLLFADDIFIYVFITLTITVVVSFFLSDTVGRANAEEHERNAAVTFKKRFTSFTYISALIITIAFGYSYLKSNNFYWSVFSLTTILNLLFPILLAEIKYKYDKLYAVKFSTAIYNLCLTSWASASLIIILSLLDARRVDNGKYMGTMIQTSDSTLVSDSTFFFIGKTDNYILMYSKKDSSATIIPNNQIKKMVLKSK